MSSIGMKWWSESRVEKLLKMRSEGQTYEHMAEKLGVSREAIAGKLRRLEKDPANVEYRAKRNEALKAQKAAGLAPPKDRHGRSTKAAYQIVSSVNAVREYKDRALDEYSTGRLPGVPLEELRGCRYALTSGTPHMFCDAPRKDGSSYCDHHHSLCQPVWAGSESERTAVKSAEWLVVNEKAGYIPA